MALQELAGGTQTAVVTTEHTLATLTNSKTMVLVVDTVNLVNGDIVELRLKTKARAGGTSRLAYFASYANLQSEIIKYSIPVPANVELVATLKQTLGTARDFVWAILGLD